MRKTLLLLGIVSFVFGMVSCDLDTHEDLLFFYTAEVVDGGGVTYATWDYEPEGYEIIMTRWYETDYRENTTRSKADALRLQEITEFTLVALAEESLLTGTDPISVAEYHNGYEVMQRFYFALPVGTHTLQGATINVSDASPPVRSTLRTDKIHLTIR